MMHPVERYFRGKGYKCFYLKKKNRMVFDATRMGYVEINKLKVLLLKYFNVSDCVFFRDGIDYWLSSIYYKTLRLRFSRGFFDMMRGAGR
jgi:hypothetical protein